MTSPELRIDDAQGYLERVITKLRVQERPGASSLVAVLNHISRYIQFTQREIVALRSPDPNASHFSNVSDELKEVVEEAARATHEIVSATEEIERLGAKGGTPDPALTELLSRIYVACGFQDITGQRISNVLRALESIESKLTALATACGGEVELQAAAEGAERQDDPLLHGPQRAGAAHTQDEIDQLFDNLK